MPKEEYKVWSDNAFYEAEAQTGFTFSYGADLVSNPILLKIYIFFINVKQEIYSIFKACY